MPIVAPRSPADCFDTAIEAARIAHDLPDAGDPALRRLPGQRLRAVADPGRRRPARPARRSSPPSTNHDARRRATESSGPTCATPRRWPGRGPSPAPPGSSTASAASRRPTAPATSPTTRPTTTSWSAPGRPRSTASPRRSRRSRSTTRPARRGCWCSAGARRTGRSAPPAGSCAPTGVEVAQAHLRHLNPFPADLGEVLRALRQGAGPGDEPRPARRLLHPRRKYLVDAIGYNQVRGLPFKAEELAGGHRGRASQ